MKNYLIAMSFCAVVLAPAMTLAAPVTFQFEAEIIDVDVLAPADLPFSVENGDILKGRFTFEPVDAQPGPLGVSSTTDTVQEFSFSLSIDSTVLSKPSYSLGVRDNSPTIDATSSFDSIFLSVLGESLVPPVPVPGTDNIFWGLRLPLSTEGSVLFGADISADPDIWNQFEGGFTLNFQELSGTNIFTVLSINASIRNFSVVPEPSTFCLMVLSLAAISVKQNPRLRT